MMRVIIYGFTGNILGGIETFILNMNEHMTADCVFDYIIDSGECKFNDRIIKRGGRIFYIPWIRKKPIKYIKSLWRVLGEQKNLGTQIFYYQLFSMTKIIPAILARMRGYKVILHAHNNGLQKASKSYIILHRIGRLISKYWNFIYFTNSQLSTNFMFGKDKKAEIIYNAVDTNLFRYDDDIRKIVREEIGCSDRTVIGFVGRFVRQKNPLFLIKIFSKILELKPNCELWIVGEGELKESMDKEIERYSIGSSVKYLGVRKDVNRLMQGMDILLQPSLFEGLGIVLIEAQATGLFVLSSAKVIPQEAIVSNKIKLIPLEETPTYWAENAVEICNLMEKNTRQTLAISRHFNIDIEAIRLEKLLKSYNYQKDKE